MNVPTPLVALPQYDDALYAKVEYLHPSGSMKHRAIVPFLEALKASGELEPGQRIAILSVGAAAVTAAWVGARIGHAVVAVLPPTTTAQTVNLLRWLGATCHQVEEGEIGGLMQALGEAPDTYVLAQTHEERLIDHYRPVGREILAELGQVAAITVGIGTGLSITGIGREVKAQAAGCRVVGVEPAEAAIASGNPWAPHNIPGLAPPVPQPLLDKTLVSDIVPIPSDEAWRCAREVAQGTGLLLGPSSGATVAAALRLRGQSVTGPIVAVCACSMGEYVEKFGAVHDLNKS